MANVNRPSEGFIVSYLAEGAVTKYAAVMAGTADTQVKLPTGANVDPVGITLNAAADGEEVDVVIFGPTICIADAAIARGALVAISSTTGKVDTITPGTTTADKRLVGKALEAAGADGDQFSVFIGLSDFVVV